MSFPTTNWTHLAGATLHGDESGRDALARLCAAYRPPVVEYLTGRGLTHEQAEDYAQDFMVKLLESRAWKRADQSKGRFRNFLLGILNHLVQQSMRDNARQKRGGGIMTASLEAMSEEGVELTLPQDIAEVYCFDRAWAHSLVAQVLLEVEAEYVQRGQEREFSVVRVYLPGDQTPPSYEESAAVLGQTCTVLKSSIYRLRQRFRERLRQTVARTVSAPHEVDEELRYLGSLLMARDQSSIS